MNEQINEATKTNNGKTKFMKKILAATILAGAMVATSVWAIPSSGEIDVTRNVNYFGSGAVGGETTLTAAGNTAPFSFQTFCIEYNERVGDNPQYYEINPYDAAVAGGLGGWKTLPDNTQGDPISLGTAYLYSQFAKGTLAGYDYTPGAGREASALKLQYAIWWLEDEVGETWGKEFRSLLMAPELAQLRAEYNITDEDGWKADANGAFGVKVLNVYNYGRDESLIYRQDFLQVPDGGLTLAFLGMGLAGLAGMRRIRK
ncbi:MAG: VPDSG-CTERM sorting domain-containing protein [Verrucomicrobia bacterium]|nr:VPDSG-CTERM sorting domain-containing protein [Verrucomicrobiota bacterium]